MSRRLSGSCTFGEFLLLTFVWGASAWTPVTLSFESLQRGLVGSEHKRFVSAVQHDGIVAVTDAPGWAAGIETLRREFPACVEEALETGKASRVDLVDGSTRATLALTSDQHFPTTPSGCSETLSEGARSLRESMFSIGDAFVQTLVHSSLGAGALEFEGVDGGRRGLVETVLEGTHLDHFHVYKPPVDEEHARPPQFDSLAMPLHTDRGLFLVLAPSEDQSLVTELGAVELKDVERTALVLVGDGLASWAGLNVDRLGRGVRPCLHAVKRFDEERQVFGRMFMPKKGVTAVYAGDKGREFFDFFYEGKAPPQVPSSSSSSEDLHIISRRELAEQIEGGDAESMWRRLADTQCAAGEVYCWMQCMRNDTCGEKAVCWDWEKSDLCPDDGVHHFECGLKCPPASKAAAGGGDEFCSGATSMLMLGFESAMRGGKTQTSCIVWLFPGFVLRTPLLFALGCLLAFGLGFLADVLIFSRRLLMLRASKRGVTWQTETLTFLLFLCNIIVGYLAMLLAMTYNFELFMSTCLGLTTGHFVLNRRQPVGESAEPCCLSSPNSETESAPATTHSLGADSVDRVGQRNRITSVLRDGAKAHLLDAEGAEEVGEGPRERGGAQRCCSTDRTGANGV